MAKRPTRKPATDMALAAPTGENTRKQSRGGGVFSISFGGMSNAAPPPGTYETYREMLKDPTIILARAASNAPIKAAKHSYELEDGGTDEMLAFVRDVIDPLYASLMREMLRALDYGWQPFEIVWEIRGGRMVASKVKPLLPDLTKILVNDKGALTGIENQGVTLPPNQCLVFTYDGEAGDYYGRSIMENIREKAWQPYNIAWERLKQYMHKAAGIIPMVTYPMGTSLDASGAEVDNGVQAGTLLSNLGQGMGVAMPQDVNQVETLLRAGASDPDKVMAWRIGFIEAKGLHGAEFLDSMRYFDSLKMRGRLVPERVALEGQHGTLAESEAQADVSLSASDETLGQVVTEINAQLIEPLLVANYGPQARRAVRVVAAPIVSDERAFIREITKQLLVGNPDLALGSLDFDSMLDQTGAPKAREIVDVNEPGAVPPGNSLLARALAGSMKGWAKPKRKGRGAA